MSEMLKEAAIALAYGLVAVVVMRLTCLENGDMALGMACLALAKGVRK